MKCSSCFGAARKGAAAGGIWAHHGVDDDLLRDVNHIAYSTLRSATDDFDIRRRIGRGGFGTVYKGTLPKNGRKIAVKTLSVHSKQGVKEFLNEIRAMSKAKHPNLVELIGCCIHGANRILVYEFVENNSLYSCLLGSRNRNVKLDWGKRAAICLGVARGLAYLHDELAPHIVHRDIKASNILLDKDFTPKIGDFGLAKLFPDDITHISTRIAGTTGYLAPEYALGGQLTKKADVYSFGILVLEILSGRSSSKSSLGGTQKLLLEQAWELNVEGRLLELVDSEMGESVEEEAVVRYMKVAFFCTQSMANRRPSMSHVVEMLSKNIPLRDQLLSPPGFFLESDRFSEPGSVNNKKNYAQSSCRHSSVPVTVTEITPR